MRRILHVCFFMVTFGGYAQQISIDQAISKDYKPKLSGNFNASSVYNSAFPVNRLNYFLSASLNVQVNQFVMPVSFNYSDRKFQFSQAYTFNQASFNPSYKWVSAQIGITNSQFSQYSLNGHQYTGVGLNLRPGKWNIQLMTGRLLKATATDTIIGPTFNRMGYGAKTSVRLTDQIQIGTSFFYASDRANSLSETTRIFQGIPVNPSENLVLGFDFNIRPVDFLEWRFEIHNSLLNGAENDSLETFDINTPTAWIMKPKSGSRSYNAVKTDISLRLPFAQTLVGVGYEKVDPDYRTLGGYYFVNDIQNYTVNLSTSLLNQKWNLNGRIGLQEDDLAKTKSSTQRRFVASLNSDFRLSNSLNISSAYSNMQTFMFVRDAYQEITQVPGQPIDSLDYSQISQNFNTSINKNFEGTETYKSSLAFNVNYANAQGRNGPILRDETQSNITNLSIRYSSRFPKKALEMSYALSFNQNKFDQGLTRGYGPSIQLSKTLADNKLRLGLSSSLLRSQRQQQNINAFNSFLNASWQLFKNQTFRLNAGLVSSSLGANYQNINLTYGLNF